MIKISKYTINPINIDMSRKIVVGMSSVTRRYQITIPKKVRKEFDIKEGDSVFFIIEETNGDKRLILMKSPVILE